MKATRILHSARKEGLSAGGVAASDESDYKLKVAVMHHDEPTRALAGLVLQRAAQSVDMRSFHCAWWSMDELLDSRVLDQAVQSAVEADLIVVSVRVPGELPAGLCVWIDFWLPRRPQGSGALMALIGGQEEPCFDSAPARDYLRAVARRAHLDYLEHESPLPTIGPSALVGAHTSRLPAYALRA
jgi:hypothetical protein